MYLGGSIFVGYLVLHLLRRMLSHIEIVLDRTCQSVSFRYNQFLKKPSSVVLRTQQITEVVVDRFRCQRGQCLCWALWLQRRDGIKNLIDAGNQKKPISKLATDLSETLKVPLKDLSNDPPPATHRPYQTIQQLFDR
jgi:hypothetical protein